MKIERILTMAVALLMILSEIDCTSHDASLEENLESYRTEHWQTLMKDFSDLDGNLNSTSNKQIKPLPYFTHFQQILLESGLSSELVENIVDVLTKYDKTYEGPAYHGLVHSARIANLMSLVLHTEKAKSLNNKERILIVIAAIFHDVDPDRLDNTPARVWATFEWMDKNQDAIALFDKLKKEKNITKDQVKTIIKFTDFNEDKSIQEKLKAVAEKMAEKYFDDGGVLAKAWGMRLAYIDQVCMYVGSFKFAVQAVVGLANEIRNVKMAQKTIASSKDITSPTDVAMLSNTSQFLALRLADPNFLWLPLELQENFKSVQKDFQNIWYGKKRL